MPKFKTKKGTAEGEEDTTLLEKEFGKELEKVEQKQIVKDPDFEPGDGFI